jgi:hypothetical protein
MSTDTVYQNTFVGTPYWMVSLAQLEFGEAVADRCTEPRGDQAIGILLQRRHMESR